MFDTQVLKNEIYKFLTNLNIFFKKVRIENTENINLEKIIINTEFLYNSFQENKIKISDLKTVIILASKILSQLKDLKCDEEFIFEKADLIIAIFSIKEKLEANNT